MPIWNRVLVLLLLLTVPGLATLAKVSWYLPQSDQGHYLSPATKMNVVNGHAACNIESPQPARELVVSPRPAIAIFLDEQQENSIPRMLLRAILRHSPPSKSA